MTDAQTTSQATTDQADKPKPRRARRKSSGQRKSGGGRRKTPFCTVEEAIEAFAQGEPLIITDDEDRENEGDLALPAQFVTSDTINFMATHGRGLICVAMDGNILDRLGLRLMVDQGSNTAPLGTAFTVSVEARSGVTTGISAPDRARTVQVLMDPNSGPNDIVTPGHMFPLRARDGGTLVRAGQTEASVDLCRLAGLQPGAVICEIMKRNGEMARLPDLTRFSKRHGLKMVSVEQIIQYRLRTEQLVERVTETRLPTPTGTWRLIGYRTADHLEEHIALVMGNVTGGEPVLVRVHSQCLTGDVFSSQRCDCGEQLDIAMQMVAEQRRGVIVYMAQEGTRHRPAQQDRRLRAPGPGHGHGRGQPRPWLRGRPARLRHRNADPARPRRAPHPADDQQPGQAARPLRLRPGDRRARAGHRRGQPAQRPLSLGQAGEDGPPARPGRDRGPTDSTEDGHLPPRRSAIG